MTYEKIGKGIVKRTKKRVIGLFIDGTGLDRATRRINRKVDMSALIRGVTSGLVPTVARYYTLIPYEDDSRHRAFLDAVARAGLSVIVKRLPPKGITRQVNVDVEIAADIVAFAAGHSSFSDANEYKGELPANDYAAAPSHSISKMGPSLKLGIRSQGTTFRNAPSGAPQIQPLEVTPEPELNQEPAALLTKASEERIVTLVCPSRDLAYPMSLAKELGVDTVTADFGQFNTGDVLKSAAKWIDLSDSETIWRD